MTFPFWVPLPPETQLSELTATSLLVTRQDYSRAVVCTVSPSDGRFTLRWAVLPDLQQDHVWQTDAGRFHDRSSALGMGRAYDVVAIPPVQWRTGGRGVRARVPVTVLLSLVTAIALLTLGGVQGAALAIPAAAGVALLAWLVLREPRPTRILTAGGLTLDGTNLVDYSIARQIGDRPELLTDEQRRADIRVRVDDILAEYGRLATDIVFRIENSALFDAAVPATEAFQVAMVRYEAQVEELDLDALDELATELEISYSMALDHAETVGLGHLPSTARSDGRRAAKAARLAANAGSDAERDAAMEQVVRILRSLALYYLPEPDGVRNQLTGSSSPTTPSPEPGPSPRHRG